MFTSPRRQLTTQQDDSEFQMRVGYPNLAVSHHTNTVVHLGLNDTYVEVIAGVRLETAGFNVEKGIQLSQSTMHLSRKRQSIAA